MISQANIQYWISIGDKRSRDERIQQARGHARSLKQRRLAALEMDSQKKTPEEQLAALNYRLGVGYGAKKERKRLTKLIKGE